MVVKKSKIQVLKKASVDSSIDMRISKSDIIELMVEEEESKLDLAAMQARKEFEEFVDKTKDELEASFRMNNAFFISQMEKLYGKLERNTGFGYGTNVTLATQSRQHYDTFSVSFPFPEDKIAEFKVLSEKVSTAERACRDFRNNKSKYKTALTRRMLEGSIEGQEILKKLKEVKGAIALPKGE